MNSFREQLPQIEAALQEAQLHVIPNNLAVIGAISFYKLTNATKYQHFLSWVKENSITRVPGLHMNDLIQIFDQIYENIWNEYLCQCSLVWKLRIHTKQLKM